MLKTLIVLTGPRNDRSEFNPTMSDGSDCANKVASGDAFRAHRLPHWVAETQWMPEESAIENHYRHHHLSCYREWSGTIGHHPLRLIKTFSRPGYVTLLTDGMSDFYTANAQELLLYARELKPWHGELMRAIVEMIEQGTLIDWGDTLTLPDHLMRNPNSYVAVTLMPVFLESSEFETLFINDEPVQFLMVVPINQDQALLAEHYGGVVLENTLGRTGHDFSA